MYYDKLFIIKNTEDIREYTGDEYYDMQDLLFLQKKPKYIMNEWNVLYTIILILVISILIIDNYVL